MNKTIPLLICGALLSGCSATDQIKQNTHDIAELQKQTSVLQESVSSNTQHIQETSDKTLEHTAELQKHSVQIVELKTESGAIREEIVGHITRIEERIDRSVQPEPAPQPERTTPQPKNHTENTIASIAEIIIRNESPRGILNLPLDLEVTVSTNVSESTKSITKKITHEIAHELRMHGFSVNEVKPTIHRTKIKKNPLGISIQLLESGSEHVISHYDVFIQYGRDEGGKKEYIEKITVKKMKTERQENLIRLVPPSKTN